MVKGVGREVSGVRTRVLGEAFRNWLGVSEMGVPRGAGNIWGSGGFITGT